MDTLLRFGTYTFDPDDQILLRDNFRNVLNRHTKLPGLSGGFDEYGRGVAPVEEGNVLFQMLYEATSEADMDAKKLALGSMKAQGKKRLYKQPVNTGRGEVYCEARIENIDFTEKSGSRPEKRLEFSINFKVDNPFWLSQGTEAPQYGDGSIYGSGVVYGGTPVTQSLVGTDNSFSITPNGNDISYPRITLEVPAGQSAENIRIQRLVNNVVIDQVRYAGVLAAGDILEINCRSYAVYLNGGNGYTSDFSFNTSAWLKLIGGTENIFRVLMENSGDEIDLEMRYYEAYNV